MALRELDYQSRVLACLDDYLDELVVQKRKADKIEAANAKETDPELTRPIPDFPLKAWEAMRAAGKLPRSRVNTPYSPRLDGIGRAVPNIVFKVPTGGGKTFLAVSSLSKIFGKYLGRHTGFVLWIVPNEAIYTQTKRQLVDRLHPYRQMLDVLSGAPDRVRILEKDDHLDSREVESHLTVMLLMLQAGNRENKDSLKIFRDRGDVRGFFPPEGDQEGHALERMLTPNLDVYDLEDSAYPWPQVKDSLGNALRKVRPVVVMDEGHKAISDLAFGTLYGFNPCFVLELTATPKDVAAFGGRNPRPARFTNILVEVKGTDLDREGMIKMPLNLDPRRGSDWRNTLSVALSRLRQLDGVAEQLQAESGRFIRPIMLVQVERTGGDQRDGTRVHALDAKEWLTTIAGFSEDEIALKTADTNDLSSPENHDLLSPLNRVRVIITKQALQEGWDCPFAYVLCALAASANLSAMTQLVGRILRQPHAQKSGVPLLDESYVITHHANTTDVVSAIKQGLEEDGMGDLVKEIKISGYTSPQGPRAVKRRTGFAHTEIFLPLVSRVTECEIRPIDYDQDILFHLNWEGVDVSQLADKIPDNITCAEVQMQRIRLVESENEKIIAEAAGGTNERLTFDPAYAAKMISDVIPNAWWCREIVGNLVQRLVNRGFDGVNLGARSNLIIEELRKWLIDQRNIKAEALFRAEVVAGRIQFHLRTDGRNWRMPFEVETNELKGSEQLIGNDGGPLGKSLFSPVYKADFSNQDERDVAVYLDGEHALTWWHRNVARSNYAIQGWRREKIYPDFIFAVQYGESKNKVVALEMKGAHLAGNDDTTYKRDVLKLMSEAFAIDSTSHIGGLELVEEDGTTVECDLVLFQDWKTSLPAVIGC